MTSFGVVLFHTTSSAFRAEKVVAKAHLAGKLVPTPREFSSDCGIALCFNWSQVEQVRASMESARVEIAGIHPL
jgi:hypothetical protein